MHLRPVGQCAIPISEDTEETDTLQEKSRPEPTQEDSYSSLVRRDALDWTPATR